MTILRKPLWFLTIVLYGSACNGLPLPTSNVVTCAPHVYIEVGAAVTCDTAMLYIKQATEATGIPASEARTIEFVAADNLAAFGSPKAWGMTEGADIAITARHANSVIHEFYHLHDISHCNWSTTKLQVFNDFGVAGAFDDTCQHVHCESSWGWTDSVTRQFLGTDYRCTPLP